jgi:hypothetical protein
MRIVFPSNFIIILNVQQYRTESAVVYQSLFRVWLDKIEGFAREPFEEIARGSGLNVDVVMARHLFLRGMGLCHLKVLRPRSARKG